jgi:murein DD-endopeptidase MepM/ murein hydrolase activator NlpD
MSAVATGARVREGDVLGQVGNSGNSSQPHPHLHAERGGVPDAILTGQGASVRRNGRFLVRNGIFRE